MMTGGASGKKPRVLKSKVLEGHLLAAQKELKVLTKQNALLRAKQAMQFELLREYEGSVHHMGVLLCELAEASNGMASDDVSILSAAMVDLQAQALLQQLCPDPGSRSNHGNRDDATTSSIARSDSGASASSTCNNTAVRYGSSSCDSVEGSAGLPDSRTQRNLRAITPEAVLAMRGISAQQLAGEFKSILMRIALLKHCAAQGNTSITDTLEEAVEAFGTVSMLAMIAADQQFLQVTCMNLDTMQQELPADDLWARVTAKAALQPKQKVQICLAFQCYMDQRSPLLQRQRAIVQQLQDLLDASVETTIRAAGISTACSHVGSPAAAAASCGDVAGAATSGSNNSSSTPLSSRTNRCIASSSLWNEAAPLEIAEKAEQLLLQLQRVVSLQREASRRLVYLWINLLSVEQHANVLLAAYPFTVKIPAVCACVWQKGRGQLGI